MMEANLIVYYAAHGGYLSSKIEVHNLLTKFGDQKADIELLCPGVMAVKTSLDARKVVDNLSDLYVKEPSALNYTVKWIPVDYWCSPAEIVSTVKDEYRTMFAPTDQFSVKIVSRGKLNEQELLSSLKPFLRGSINDEHPQKILRIEVFDKLVAVALLRPHNIISK